MTSNSEVHLAIQVTVMVHVWQGTDFEDAADIDRPCDGHDMISLQRTMPIDGNLDAINKTYFHLPEMANRCAQAIASRLKL